MPTYKPGRLYRVLGKVTSYRSLFGMYSEPLGTLYDADIHSLVMHRGKEDRGGGSFPTTLEATVKGQYSSSVAGENVRVFLRDEPAVAVAAHCGTTAEAIKQRFAGRMGQTDVEDTGKRFTTTFGAASWLAQMNYSPVYFAPPAGMSVVSALAYLAHSDEPNRGINMVLHGDAGKIATDQPLTLFKDGVGKYAEDIGILLQERRNGETHIMPLLYRKGLATTQVATTLPLTRSQAISPAKWEQRNERPAVRIEYLVTNAEGGPARRVAEVANTTGEIRETEELDWTYIQVTDVDNQLYREAYGRVLQSSTRQFTVPSVTIDLLHLIGSSKDYHHKQAGQLLALEHGEPVYFSADWPAPLRGVHFAEGINETVDADTWTLELSLVPYAHAMGDTPTPTVPGRTWDSLAGTWNQQTQKWNQL